MYIQKRIHFFHDLILWICKRKTGLYFTDWGCIVMKLIMNLPTTADEKKEFNEQFSKLQAKLVIECIKDLPIDDTSRKELCMGVLNELREKVVLGKEEKDE